MSDDEQGAAVEMPRYKCHKEVWALKIDRLKARVPDDGTLLMCPAEPGYADFILDAEFVKKHNPQAGGYYVVYRGGYKSFSPAAAFEEGYSKID